MKQLKNFLLLCMVFLLISGCGLGSSSNDQTSAGGANNDVKEIQVEFEVISTTELPESLQGKANELTMSKNGGKFIAKADQKTFIVIALGERKTGGYSVEIEKVIQKGNTLKVYAKEEAPPEGSFVTQVITYPATVVVVKGDKFDPVEVYLNNKLFTGFGETQ